MTKQELKNGMFGVDSHGEVFVVAGDKLIYECGQYDNISEMTDNLEFATNKIVELHEATCFNEVNYGRSLLIWKRNEHEGVEADKSKITITEEEFLEVVKEANELFMSIGNKVPGSELADAVMGLQNITFGALLCAVLFGKEIE